MKKWIDILKKTYAEWSDDNCLQIGAALSFYTLSSLVPLLLLITSILTYVALFTGFGAGATQQVIDYIGTNAGQETASALNDAIAQRQDELGRGGIIGAIVGFATLLFAASGVFGQLDTAFDDIWDVPEEAKPTGIIATIKAKFFSFGLVFAVAFILLVSTVLTQVVGRVVDTLAGYLPAGGVLIFIANIALTLAITTLVFALLFKYLPSTKVEWRDVLTGGLLTAILWVVGQQLLTLYFQFANFSSSGIIGGVLAFLVYVYYSSQIVFIGGEFTQVYARTHGSQAQTTDQATGAAATNQPSAVERALAEARKRELKRKDQELAQAQRQTRGAAASSGVIGLVAGVLLGGVALVAGIARGLGRFGGGRA